MAGGATPAGLSDSILEVPTYTIALVFLFFLVVSTIFEWAVHWLSHKFEQWGRVGLVEALQKLVQELTLLGLISLILVTFQTSLTKFCINYSDNMALWTLIDNIDGCPCCLVHTKGVSTCAQIDHVCLVNTTNNYSPYCACGQPPEDVLSEDGGDCASYQGAELQYFINQVPSTLALTSKVYQLVYDNVTVDDLCDSFCCIANVTWNSNDLRDVTNADVQCDPLLMPGTQHSDSGSGRRLLGAPQSIAAPTWGEPGGSDSLATFLAAGQGMRVPGHWHPPAKAAVAAGKMHAVTQLGSYGSGMQAELSEAKAGRRVHPQQRRRRLQQAQQAPSGQSTDDSGDQVSDVDEDLITALDSMIHAKRQPGRKKANETEVYIVPGQQTFKCTGPFLASLCPDGQVPAISNSAMHQIHLWIFLIAIFHVTTSIVMIILSGYRLRQWRRWQVVQLQGEAAEEAANRQDGEEGERVVEMGHIFPGQRGRGTSGGTEASPDQPASPAVDTWKAWQGRPGASPAAAESLDAGNGALAEQAAPAEPPFAQNGSNGLYQTSSGGSSDGGGRAGSGVPAPHLRDCVEPDTASDAGEAAEEAPTRLHTSAHALQGASSTASSASLAKGEGAEEVFEAAPGPPPAALAKPSTLVDETGLAAAGGGKPPLERQPSRQASQAASSWRQLQRRWYRRSTIVRRRRDFAMEAFTVFTQALMPNLVRRHQFLMIRSAYIACSDPGVRQPSFDFVKHMLLCLERDASRIVGLSIEMWLVVIVWVLLSGLVTWSGQIFLWGAAGLLLAVDLTLVAMLRYACRGSQPMLSSGERRLASWMKAELLLIPIRMILFLCSLLYSTTVFLAWQFGAKSCWFSGDNFLWYAVEGLPWWMGLVLGSVLLLWVSLVTIPAYSLAVHATRHEDPPNQVEDLTPVARSLLHQMTLAHQASHIRSQAELGALHEENLRLRRLLSAATSTGSPPNLSEGVEGGA